MTVRIEPWDVCEHRRSGSVCMVVSACVGEFVRIEKNDCSNCWNTGRPWTLNAFNAQMAVQKLWDSKKLDMKKHEYLLAVAVSSGGVGVGGKLSSVLSRFLVMCESCSWRSVVLDCLGPARCERDAVRIASWIVLEQPLPKLRYLRIRVPAKPFVALLRWLVVYSARSVANHEKPV